jgi:hypothetical protein
MQSSSELTTYDDFEVEIGIGTGLEYPVAVIRSSAGEVHETMHFPFDKLALESRLKDLKIMRGYNAFRRRTFGCQLRWTDYTCARLPN